MPILYQMADPLSHKPLLLTGMVKPFILECIFKKDPECPCATGSPGWRYKVS